MIYKYTAADLKRAVKNHQRTIIYRQMQRGSELHDVARLHRISPRTVQRIVKLGNDNDGVVPPLTFKPRSAPKSLAIQQEISSQLNRHGSFASNEIVSRIDRSLKPSQCYVNYVAKQTDHSIKTASKVAHSDTPRMNTRRTLALQNLRNSLVSYRRSLGRINEIDLIFSDESRCDHGRLRGQLLHWTKVYQPLHLSDHTQVRDPSVNVISFHSVHQLSYNHFDDANSTAAAYTQLVKEVLILKRNVGIDHVLLVLDNTRVHSRAYLTQLQHEFPNFTFCFLPIYAPELKICELFFSKLKSKPKFHFGSTQQLNLEHWKRKVEQCTNQIQNDSQNTLKHVEAMCNVMFEYNGSLEKAAASKAELDFKSKRRRFRNEHNDTDNRLFFFCPQLPSIFIPKHRYFSSVFHDEQN